MPVLIPLLIPAPGKQSTTEVLQGWGNFAGGSVGFGPRRATALQQAAQLAPTSSSSPSPHAVSSHRALKEMPVGGSTGFPSLSLYLDIAEHPGGISFLRAPAPTLQVNTTPCF